jgi:hypothetical protein
MSHFRRDVSSDELRDTTTRIAVPDKDLLQFLRKTEKPITGDYECVYWGGCKMGGRDSRKPGYQHGQIRWHGKCKLAHRISYYLFVDDIPDGMFVLHKCPTNSNGRCVNPRHLVLGTQLENIRDTVREGTHRAPAKITAANAADIRRRFAAGEMQRTLADEFGISRGNVSTIAIGRSWKNAS